MLVVRLLVVFVFMTSLGPWSSKAEAVDSCITTVAGQADLGFAGDGGKATESKLFNPSGVLTDNSGSLYIADTFNHRIRKVGPKGKIETILSREDYPSLRYPSQLVLDSNGSILVAVTKSNQLLRIDSRGTVLDYEEKPKTLKQGTLVDPNGNTYVAEQERHQVRIISPEGEERVIAGNGKPGFSGDGGPAIFAQLNHPTQLSMDADGNLYVADNWNFRIRKISFDEAEPYISTFVGSGEVGLIHYDYGTGEPVSYPKGGGFAGDGGPANQALLFSPSGMTFDSFGNFYFSDGPRIRKVTVGATCDELET